MTNTPILRAMSPADLPAVLAIQVQAYSADYLESEATLARKLALAPGECWVASDASSVLAYLFCHGWAGPLAPAWNAELDALPAADYFYLHDLAVAPAARGRQLGERLLQQARRRAQQLGLTEARLTAVQGALPFWQRQGFTMLPDAAAQRTASYGDEARLMQAHWPSPQSDEPAPGVQGCPR